jgi:hypothetical protein
LSKDGHWGVGYYSQYLNELSQNSQSEKSFLGETFVPVSYKSSFNFWGGDYLWYISLGGLLPTKKVNDDAADVYLIQLAMGESFWEESNTSWFYGLGLNYGIIKGKGGTVELNNGSGTSSFQLPSETRSYKILYLELGYMYEFSSFRLDSSIQFDNFFGDSRSYSLLVNAYFPMGGL